MNKLKHLPHRLLGMFQIGSRNHRQSYCAPLISPVPHRAGLDPSHPRPSTLTRRLDKVAATRSRCPKHVAPLRVDGVMASGKRTFGDTSAGPA